jgi:hypothetical protein
MAGGDPDGEGQFVVVGQSFHGFLLGSQMFFLLSRHSWR